MVKTTLKEIKKAARFNGRAEFKKYLQDNGLKPVSVKLIAYSVSAYGLGAYLAMFTLDNGLTVNVNTGNRSCWNYSIRNSDFGLDDF